MRDVGLPRREHPIGRWHKGRGSLTSESPDALPTAQSRSGKASATCGMSRSRRPQRRRTSAPSPMGLPTTCSDSGRPSRSKPIGNPMAGLPVTLKGRRMSPLLDASTASGSPSPSATSAAPSSRAPPTSPSRSCRTLRLANVPRAVRRADPSTAAIVATRPIYQFPRRERR